MTHTMGYHEIMFLVLVTILAVVLWAMAVTPIGGA